MDSLELSFGLLTNQIHVFLLLIIIQIIIIETCRILDSTIVGLSNGNAEWPVNNNLILNK